MKKTLKCQICLAPLTTKGAKKFCSRKCYGAAKKSDDFYERLEKVEFDCDVCGTHVIKDRWNATSKTRFCSRDCAIVGITGVQQARRSEWKSYICGYCAAPFERRPHWKGVVYCRKECFVAHQKALSHNKEAVYSFKKHRAIAEEALGHAIPPGYDVHHINHDTTDNRPENLLVLSREEHGKLHALEFIEARKKDVIRRTSSKGAISGAASQDRGNNPRGVKRRRAPADP